MLNAAIRHLLQRESGLDLSDAVIDSAVRRAMRAADLHDRPTYAARLLHDRALLDALIEQVIVPETWFFRDADAFSAACIEAQARYARLRRPVRILSLPCATGEEPYSLAIALSEAGMTPASFHIDGIDISRRAIDAARCGVYTLNAFRSTDTSFRERYFTPHGGNFLLREAIRQQATLSQGNLFSLPLPADNERYDLVFCRNLLIYFDEATQAAAIRRLDALLQADGMLFSGYAETAVFCRHGFVAAPFAKAFALLRAPGGSALEPAAVQASPPRRRRQRPAAAPSRPPLQAAAPHLRVPTAAPANTLEQARLLADTGRIAEACACYQAYLRATPDSAEAYFMLGVLSAHQQHAGSAEQYLRRALYLDPDHYEALCHLALLAEQHGDRIGAAGFKRRAARVQARRSGGTGK